MSININSEAACRKAYLNYHCYGNTMGITTKQMSEITARWESRLSSWQTTVSNDENQYEFDDSEFKDYKEQGKEAAKEATGFDGKKGRAQARGINDAVTAAGGAVVSYGLTNGALQGVSQGVGKAVGKTWGKVIGQKASNKGAAKAMEKGTTIKDAKASWVIGAPLAAAQAAAYLAKKPNQDEKNACDDMQTELTNAQGALAAEQENLQSMGEEIIALSDEASKANEEANTEIEDKKTEYDMYKSTYEALKAKVESGQQLSDDEKELYKTAAAYMVAAGEDINDLTESTGETVNSLYSDMETYQEGYDYTAETMGEVEGQTDFAAGFDTATRDMCYVEGAAQSVNALSGYTSMVKAGKFAASGGLYTAWAWAFAAMGAAGGAISTVGATEQFTWAGDVGKEIDIRKQTEDLNAETLDVYTEEVDSYAGWMQGVDDLELEIPNDIEAPQDTALPETKTPTDKTDDKKDKKEDK